MEDVLSFHVCPSPRWCFHALDIDSPTLCLVSEFPFLYISRGLDTVGRRCRLPGAAATAGEKARSPLKPESKPLSSLPPPWGWQGYLGRPPAPELSHQPGVAGVGRWEFRWDGGDPRSHGSQSVKVSSEQTSEHWRWLSCPATAPARGDTYYGRRGARPVTPAPRESHLPSQGPLTPCKVSHLTILTHSQSK